MLIAILFGVGSQRVQADASPADTPAGSSFDQRVAQRKKERSIVLSDLDNARLVGTCTSAQNKLRTFEVGMVPALAYRNKIYQQIDAKIWVTIGQLKLASSDTFSLEKDRMKLVDDSTAFQTLSSSFTQALDDTELINCKADPVGFKALLETDRLYYADLQTQSTDLHDFIVNSIKTELSTHATDLQPKTPTSGNN